MKTFKRTEEDRLNGLHAAYPMSGDYWEEHFVGYFVVLEPVVGGAIVCDQRIKFKDGWTWDLERSRFMSDDEIYTTVRYSGNYDGWVARVHPNLHMASVRDWREAGSPVVPA